MAGYVGTKAVLLSTTAATVGGDADIGGALDVGGAFTSQGIDDNATSTAMTLDASGNLLVGTTDSIPYNNNSGASADFGFVVNKSFGFVSASAYNNTTLLLNRTSTGGDLIEFRKDGSTVGSIKSVSSGGGGISIDNEGTEFNLDMNGGSNSTSNSFFVRAGIYPFTDNYYDIGRSSNRWDDIYATNGTIQTSDRNEKQDIAELTDAEQRVAVAAKGLLRKFRWRDAVAEKDDEARTHFGIIAQDLQAAFVAEGLDAGDYAMFISTTWWEHDVEVPAVEAVAEVLDEDGNVVTEAVEAVDSYTRTDTYETQEEAPEGAAERTRLGVRYSELLAFIIGAL